MKIARYILPLMLGCATTVWGQTKELKGSQSIEIKINPSYSNLMYESTNGNSDGEMGLGFELGYTYHITNRWGVGTGLRYQPFKAGYKNQNFNSTSATLTEPNGHDYTINQIINNKEEQHVNYLMIPVLASYRLPINERLAMRVAVGAAYGIATAEEVEFVEGTINRTAYFPKNDLVVDNLPEQTLGTFSNFINKTSEKQFGNTLMGLAEVGVEYSLNGKWLLTASFNGAIGGDVKNESAAIVQPNIYQSVTATDYVGTVKPVSMGLSLGVVYRF